MPGQGAKRETQRMYTKYWGLAETPFQSTIDPRWFYTGPGREEAVARSLFLAESGRRCGVIVGSAGTGKSLLLEKLARTLKRSQREVALVDLLGCTSQEMLWETAAELGLAPGKSASTAALWRLVHDYFRSNQFARVPTVVLFDHLGRADGECATVLQRLLSLTSGAGAGVTFLLAARVAEHSKLWATLGRFSDLRIDLPTFDRVETGRYVNALLIQAGAMAPIFDDSGLERVFELTAGIPGEVNRLCDLALIAAAADGLPNIDESVIDAVAAELQLTPAPVQRLATAGRRVPESY